MIGKILFPQLPRDQRRRRVTEITLTLLVGFAVAAIIAVVMLKTGKPVSH
jgi:hypothetical protein